MTTWLGVTVFPRGADATTFDGAPPPAAPVAEIEDRTHRLMPASVSMKAGIIAGEMTEMKVRERVERGSDRIVSPAKLSATLRLTNTSRDQTVRVIGGKVQYIDAQGLPIKLEAARTESFASCGLERLDPGQDAIQPLDLDFPGAALQTSTLTEIRLELAFTSSPYREGTLNFAVSIAPRVERGNGRASW